MEEQILKTIINTIKEKDNFLIIADNDGDGLNSAAILRIILKKLRKNVKIHITVRSELDYSSFYKVIRKNKNKDVIIIIDRPIKDDDLIKLAENFESKIFLYIDHHKREIPSNIPKNLVYYDIRAIKKDDKLVYPCAVIAYKIGKRIFGDKFKKYSLLAALGAYTDMMFGRDKEFLEDLNEVYPGLYKEDTVTLPFLVALDVLLGFYLKDLNYYVEKVAENLVENILEVYSDKKVIKAIKNYYKVITDEYSHAYENMEFFGNVVLIKAKNRARLVATPIAPYFKNKIVVVYKELEKPPLDTIKSILRIQDKYKISVRGKLIDVGLAMKEFAEKYGIQGGGHPTAAGGIIYKRDLHKLVDFLNEKCLKKKKESF